MEKYWNNPKNRENEGFKFYIRQCYRCGIVYRVWV